MRHIDCGNTKRALKLADLLARADAQLRIQV